MKEYKYHGFKFYATDIIHANTGKRLYEIDEIKPAGKRPFLTTIQECRDYINDYIAIK